MTQERLGADEYKKLSAFRCGVRQYLNPSDAEAARHGVPFQQHQAILILASVDSDEGMTLSDLRDCLMLKPHSVVELVRRLSEARLVTRREVATDRKRIFVALTPEGAKVLDKLVDRHRAELAGLGGWMREMLRRIESVESRGEAADA